MASALIHMAVAKRVNERLNRNEKHLLLGTIAPDIGKDLNISREISHFTEDAKVTPNLDLFYNKYKNDLTDDYELGYFIHLIVDVLWFEEFLKNYRNEDNFVLKNGETIYITEEEYCKLLYNDYTNLNSQLLDYYDMDLSLFYNEYEFPKNKIEEIPYSELRRLVDKMGLICSGDSSSKEYALSIENIVHFIEYSAIYVMDKLKEYNII